jgi:predicted GIY-YIG superfamily endonuclease
MTRKPADYSCTLIYKITCKDPLITDIYVGHTTNFVQRRDEHKRGSIQNSCKLYEVIRANGGWTNWTMEIIHYFSCKDLKEAKTKEQEYFVALQATLNSVEPMGGEKKEKKEKDNAIETTQNPTFKNKHFVCIKCNYNCFKESEFIKHLLTKKHVNNASGNIKKTHIEFNCKNCDKKYKSRKGLWGHYKTCSILIKTDSQENIINKKSDEEFKFLSSMIEELKKNNSNLQKQLAEVLNITK